jgi:hypothetical protein
MSLLKKEILHPTVFLLPMLRHQPCF